MSLRKIEIESGAIEIDGSNIEGDIGIETSAPNIDLEDLKVQGIEWA